VDVRDGLVRVAATTVVVPERGQVALDVPLGAGVIRVPVAPAQSEAVFSVFRASANATLGEPLGMVALADAEAGLAIPEGSWIMRIADGRARVDRPIFVRAGEIVDLGPTWPFGRLQLTLTGAVDMARQPPTVVVFEDDPDAPQGRREVARSAASAPEFILPTGTYTVVAQHGFVDVRERITVSGGATVRSTLALGGARLTLTSRLPGDRWPAEAATEPVAYRIERLDAAPAPVYTAHRATADVTIPAGRYRIDARHGLANARVTWDVTLAVGDAVALTLDQTAGFVTFAPPARGTVVAWEVIGADGTALWTSAQPQPRAVLLAGRYTVRLETRDKRVERPIEVRAGDVLAVDMRE
jgi:Ca-activated chloride channel family protein